MFEAQSMTFEQVQSIIRLGTAAHTAPDSRTRKQRLLLGMCRLMRARTGSCALLQMIDSPPRRRMISMVEVAVERTAEAVDGSGKRRQLISDERPRRASLGAAAMPKIEVQVFRQHSAPSRFNVESLLNVGDNGLQAAIRIFRDKPRFTSGEQALLDLVHREMSWIYQSDLALLPSHAQTLSPRQRETLELLLAGYSEKEVAASLRLSRHTVHDYVKALHRRLQVSTRGELLARWIGK